MIKYYPDLIQGSDEWLAARCGLLTASEMKLIITPTLKVADNEKERIHLYELLAQRVTKYVEPTYISDDMLRGKEDEIEARALYSSINGPVTDMGFITNDRYGFTIGYSPDGLCGDDGAIEAKSRRMKYQVQTIIENIGNDRGETIPPEYMLQLQTGLLVSERKWIDFISYSGGLPMATVRVWPNEKVHNAIIEAAGKFEQRMAAKMETYRSASRGLPPTERRIVQAMYA